MENMSSLKFKIFIAALCAAMLFTGCRKEDSGAYDRAVAAFDAEDYDTAKDEFSAAASEDGRKAEGYRGEGLVYLKTGNYEYAVKFFDMSLDSMMHENEEFTEDVLFHKAEAYEKNNDQDSAIAIYETLTEGDQAAWAYALMGNAYLASGDEASAESAFQSALAADTTYDICLAIYEAYRAASLEGDGAEYLETALTLTPETPSDFMRLGQIYTYLEDYQSARENLNTAIDRGNDEAVPILGYICLQEDDIVSAKSLYNKVLDSGKKDALAYNGLAMTAMAEGQYEDAHMYIELGLNCDDEEMNESLLYNQIVAYEMELEFEKAKEKTEEYLKLYPDSADMRDEYKFLKR